MDGRRKVKDDVDRIGESLVFWISGAGRVKETAVVALLNLASHVGTVGIVSVQEDFSRADPVLIKVRKIAARSAVRSSIKDLIWNQHSVGIEPHSSRTDGRKQREHPGTPLQPGRTWECVHLNSSILARPAPIRFYPLPRRAVCAPRRDREPARAVSSGIRP